MIEHKKLISQWRDAVAFADGEDRMWELVNSTENLIEELIAERDDALQAASVEANLKRHERDRAEKAEAEVERLSQNLESERTVRIQWQQDAKAHCETILKLRDDVLKTEAKLEAALAEISAADVLQWLEGRLGCSWVATSNDAREAVAAIEAGRTPSSTS